MQQADRFLYSLVVSGGQRGRRYILKQAYSRELIDKWLCRMADVDEKKLRNGLVSRKESQRLWEAARTLNELPTAGESVARASNSRETGAIAGGLVPSRGRDTYARNPSWEPANGE